MSSNTNPIHVAKQAEHDLNTHRAKQGHDLQGNVRGSGGAADSSMSLLVSQPTKPRIYSLKMLHNDTHYPLSNPSSKLRTLPPIYPGSHPPPNITNHCFQHSNQALTTPSPQDSPVPPQITAHLPQGWETTARFHCPRAETSIAPQENCIRRGTTRELADRGIRRRLLRMRGVEMIGLRGMYDRG